MPTLQTCQRALLPFDCSVGVRKQTHQQTNKQKTPQVLSCREHAVILPDAKSRFLEPPHFPAVCLRERIFSSSSSSSSCATSFRRWSGACRPLRSSALPPPPPPPLPPLHHRLHCRRHLSLSACQSDTLTSVAAPNTTLNALPRLSLPPARAPPFSSACLLSSSLQK